MVYCVSSLQISDGDGQTKGIVCCVGTDERYRLLCMYRRKVSSEVYRQTKVSSVV